jgi:DNA relaxase NicK
MRQFAYGRSIQTEHQGDYDRAEKGRSYYLGSKSSSFRAVLYEKGIESAAEIAAAGMPPRPNLCRLEGRLRPQHSDAKVAASVLSPEEVWGCCRWGPALLRQLFSSSIQRVQMSEYRVPDTVLSRRAMAKQYFRTIGDMIAEADHDHDALGKMLAELYDSIERDRPKE